MSQGKHPYKDRMNKQLERLATKKEEQQKKETEKLEVNWDQLRKDLNSAPGEPRQIKAGLAFKGYLEGNAGFQIQRQAFRMAQEKVTPAQLPGSKQISAAAEKLFKKKQPASVLAIFNLAKALNDYQGDSKKEISLSTNLIRLKVAGELGQAVKQYSENKNEREFKTTCTQIMTQNYEYLAADVSLWNAIKKFVIKPALEFLHIDVSKRLLSSNDLIKNTQGLFKAVVKSGIEIAGEDQIDTNLNKP